MFDDYKKEVLNSYLERKESGQLDPFLQNPTTRKIKKECIRIFNMNPKREERLLRIFFDPNNRLDDIEQSIKEFDVERFRPLLSFIKQEKNIRDEEPVKILAWLIGFESYKVWRENQLRSIVNEDQELQDNSQLDLPTSEVNDFNDNFIRRQLIEGAQPKKDVAGEEKLETLTSLRQAHSKQVQIVQPAIDVTMPVIKTSWRDKLINWKAWTVTLSCLVFTFLAYAYYKLDGSEQCMYWNGNEYMNIPCSETIAEVQVLALDKDKLTKLKKITQPDTITYACIGKVWWAKVNGRVEFYTAGGDHPTIQNKRLLPITKYMIDKYIAPL